MRDVFCILGKSGSGKSTVLNKLMEEYEVYNEYAVKRLVYSTTRAKRDNEIDGVDYNYLEGGLEAFKKIDKESLVEYRYYHTKDNGDIVYFTRVSDFGTVTEYTPLICTASSEQVISYIEAAAKGKIHCKFHVIRINGNEFKRTNMLMGRCTTEIQKEEAKRRMEEECVEYDKLSECKVDILDLYNEYDIESMRNMLYNIRSFISETIINSSTSIRKFHESTSS